MADRIKTRIQMAQLLHERMNKSYTTLLEKQELEPDTTLVKTYLKEAQLSEGSSSDEVFRLAKHAFAKGYSSKNFSLHLHRTEEEFFFVIKGVFKKEPITIYLDATNPRFWILHSMNSSIALDSVLDTVVSTNPQLDRAWIPTHLLLALIEFGHFRGLNLDYDRRILPDVDFESDSTSVEFLKMQLWGNKASEVLRVLSDKGAFPHESTLSKVKIKHWVQDRDNAQFSIDDIKYDGKVTARGTSFQSHIDVIQQIHSRYRKLVTKVEEQFELRWSDSMDRISLAGEPVNFIFQRPIANLSAFCQHLFDAADPFRLWGVPVFRGEKYVRVAAVDLHVGSRINFEITDDYMRVYLPRGGCGNSVIRVYTNLQHYYSSLIAAQDGNEESLFK